MSHNLVLCHLRYVQLAISELCLSFFIGDSHFYGLLVTVPTEPPNICDYIVNNLKYLGWNYYTRLFTKTASFESLKIGNHLKPECIRLSYEHFILGYVPKKNYFYS